MITAGRLSWEFSKGMVGEAHNGCNRWVELGTQDREGGISSFWKQQMGGAGNPSSWSQHVYRLGKPSQGWWQPLIFDTAGAWSWELHPGIAGALHNGYNRWAGLGTPQKTDILLSLLLRAPAHHYRTICRMFTQMPCSGALSPVVVQKASQL